MGRRIPRLNEQLKREIAEILRFEVRDPRIGMPTVNGVEASADLDLAKVWVTVPGDEDEKRETMEGLRAAAPFIRGELAGRLRLRRIPELRFELDRTLERARRIEELLAEVAPGPEREEDGGVGGSAGSRPGAEEEGPAGGDPGGGGIEGTSGGPAGEDGDPGGGGARGS